MHPHADVKLQRNNCSEIPENEASSWIKKNNEEALMAFTFQWIKSQLIWTAKLNQELYCFRL